MIPFKHQTDIALQAYGLLKRYGMAYLAMQERTGKTLTSILVAEMSKCTNILVITKAKALKGDNDKDIVFGDELTIDHIVWMGTQPTLKEKSERVGITCTLPSDSLSEYLHKAVQKGQTIHYLPPYRAEHKLKLQEWLGIPLGRQQGSVDFIRAIVKQRSYKSEEEIAESKTEAPEQDRDDRTEQAENVQKEETTQQELHSQSVQESDASDLVSEEMLHEHDKPHPSCPLPGTPCDAFSDGELSDCRKISPQDLCHLGRRACMLRNNRFVQYGSYNFGHLLLCRNKCGQMVLGIPGAYDQQERFMANMFGFPYFKESRHIQIPGEIGRAHV